ncbi:MAG: hypothetical protein R2771_06255 [Saprospiraceae bacterium]
MAAELQAKGVLDADGTVVTGTYPVDYVGAYFNWIMLEEDRSVGVHNPNYTRALLKNSIEALK